ncbi:MAG: dTDP-4-dehydrorhamnose reductase [Acidobacteria bacterium]|nr:dTDP-4-dehydrorhamnose reductase [Acidobacteriota bacterium]
MRILLLGAGGQLATDIAAALTGDKIIPLTHAELDICDAAEVRQRVESLRPDCIVNTAAFHRVDECEEQPERSFGVNAVGVYHLARAAGAVGAILVHFSTDYVFDGAQRAPYRETDRPNPLSVYAISKRAGELIVERYCEKYFLIRTCGLYGRAGSRARQGSNFVEDMLRLAREGKPIRVVTDQVLTPTSTADLAQKLVPLLHSTHFGLYHMTNAGECSWYEFAREIFRLAGLQPDLQPTTQAELARKARRPPYSVLDNYNYRAAGFDDFRPWQEALADYLHGRGI